MGSGGPPPKPRAGGEASASEPNVLLMAAVQNTRLLFKHKLSRSVDPKILTAAVPSKLHPTSTHSIFGTRGDLNNMLVPGLVEMVKRCTAISPAVRPTFKDIRRAFKTMSDEVVEIAEDQNDRLQPLAKTKSFVRKDSNNIKKAKSRRMSAPAVITSPSKLLEMLQ